MALNAVDDELMEGLAIEMGRLIVKERKRLKMSQEDLADRLGVSQNAVTSWERAVGSHGSLHLRNILKLEQVFALARGTLLARLGLIPEGPDFEAVVLKQLGLSDEQKEALIGIYRAMLG